jgi:hypothetical protein
LKEDTLETLEKKIIKAARDLHEKYRIQGVTKQAIQDAFSFTTFGVPKNQIANMKNEELAIAKEVVIADLIGKLVDIYSWCYWRSTCIVALWIDSVA